jgi:hypothetical protein
VYADIDYETLWNLSLPELKILSELHAEKVEAMSGKKNKEFKQQAI